ncbi:hypothetical protein [Ignatzschineria larvae]|uniref:hypothetical protein n=1 Tax=Ignatzschineria larvae TaxID=112009 RepID=UPI0012EB0A39|nr:hypothetical protein [Ignatzschineria larvae]
MDLQTFYPAINQLLFEPTKRKNRIAGENDLVLIAIVCRHYGNLSRLIRPLITVKFERLKDHSMAGAGFLWICKHSIPLLISFYLKRLRRLIASPGRMTSFLSQSCAGIMATSQGLFVH